MEITLRRLNDAYHLQALNDSGNSIDLDGSPSIGGVNAGFRPMQLLLAAVGGCSAIDIISILKKQKQDLRDLQISVQGEREPDVEPSLFRDIQIHYTLFGPIDAEKARKAIDLSLDKYCSVAKTLEPTARISYTFQIEP